MHTDQTKENITLTNKRFAIYLEAENRGIDTLRGAIDFSLKLSGVEWSSTTFEEEALKKDLLVKYL